MLANAILPDVVVVNASSSIRCNVQLYPATLQAEGTVIVLIAAVPVTWKVGEAGAMVAAEGIADCIG